MLSYIKKSASSCLTLFLYITILQFYLFVIQFVTEFILFFWVEFSIADISDMFS